MEWMGSYGIAGYLIPEILEMNGFMIGLSVGGWWYGILTGFITTLFLSPQLCGHDFY